MKYIAINVECVNHSFVHNNYYYNENILSDTSIFITDSFLDSFKIHSMFEI